MGDPTYEAVRAAERVEAAKKKAAEDATAAALKGIQDFFTGKATIDATNGMLGICTIRFRPSS